MIVKLVVDAGFSAVAIDCFADTDTAALSLHRVDSLGLADLKPAVDQLMLTFGVTHVIYGSGFETEVGSLAYLQSRLVILGNTADLFRRFQDKADFFHTLNRLSIPYPETRFSSPSSHHDWLIKPMQNQGGLSIEFYCPTSTIDNKHFYWQKYLAGDTCSALFIANGDQIQVLGFNKQWIDDCHQQTFTFAGICNLAPVSDENQILIIQWLTALIKTYPLRGLGSLDFIIHEGKCYVLEINARIPASAQLYGKSLFNFHLQVFSSTRLELDKELYSSPRPMGFQIIYARECLQIPKDMTWPDWVVDRPAAGVFIGKGRPVCSIIAQESNTVEVQKRLQGWQNIIENFLQTGLYPHGISS